MNNKTANCPSLLPGIILFIFFGAMQSCTQPAKKNIPLENTPEHKDTVRRKPPCSFSDTLVINVPAAVFFNPDSLQLEKIKEITKKNEFETEVHNNFYLMRNARIVMKQYWPKIHIIETSKNRYLLFVKANNTKTCIDLNRKGDMSGIFLFDGEKEPELADMMNIDTALGFYFTH
jgi:hypothetical protein